MLFAPNFDVISLVNYFLIASTEDKRQHDNEPGKTPHGLHYDPFKSCVIPIPN